jgi:RNA polymerase sigma-70 factor, ECF subfamily
MDPLVQRCQQGELAAFSELFRRHENDVYRLAVTILRDEQAAEDAVQDVFLRVFERVNDFQANASFKTWLTAVVVNLCRDKLRRQKVRRALSLEWLRGHANAVDMADTIAERQQRQQLWTVVQRLDEKYRLPVILHYHQGLNCSEVAEVLQLPTTTVYARLNTARLRIRAMLAEATAVGGQPASLSENSL